MEVEEFHAKTWTPGEIVWVSTGSGGKNLCGKLISVFKDTVKLRMKAKEDATTEWSDTDFRVFHCRQIRKDESEKPPPIFPKIEQAKAKRHAKSKLEPTANRRVRCVETGMVFPTTDAAAKCAKVSNQTIRRACESGRALYGYHFKRV